ncbi:response regulator FixJ [Acidisphaera sp. L21]|uniref:response regulator FixJ n=1 Tax=Acidisphaera sp. L21 TaxID=1641851 RepID=UPI00131D05C7|nr:response regulator FixJ [Acidisphaera sp. L21]
MTSEAFVHLIDDDDGVRRSLAFLLTAAGHSVRVHESAIAFLAALPTIQPGCIISDVRMPGMDGIELQQRLRDAGTNLPIIIMTGHSDVPLAVKAMKAGAIDFIEKPFDDEVMLAAIRIALDEHDQAGHREAEAANVQAKVKSLTNRERQVLDRLLEGRPNKIIAYDLTLSTRTVEVHRASVMTKMAANSLSELVRMALNAGMMPSPP